MSKTSAPLTQPDGPWLRRVTYGLARRLTLVLASVIAVFVILTTLINIQTQHNIVLDRAAQKVEHAIELATEVSLPHLLAENPGALSVFFEQMRRHENIEAIELLDRDGWLLMSGDTTTSSFLAQTQDPLALQALETGQRQSQRVGSAFHAAHPIFVGDELIAILKLHLSGKSYIASMHSILVNNLACGMAMLLVGAVLSSFLARRLAKPLDYLTQATQQAAEGNLNQRISLTSNDEFQRLATTFNTMMSSLKGSMGEIHRVAYEDKLTGIPNRSWINSELEHLTHRLNKADTGFAVLFLDLDKFKGVNDNYGHHVGDLLLRAFSKRLTRCLRDEGLTVRGVDFEAVGPINIGQKDAILGRLGGDEFTLLVPTDKAENVARRITKAMESPFKLEGASLQSSTSIGIALFPLHAVTREHLLKCADVAMYQAKRCPDNSFSYYNQDAHEQLAARSQLERDLDKAIKDKAFDMVLQPQRRVGDGKVIGAEALIRWNHPVRGMVPPAEFLPAAASNGQLPKIGKLMLEKAVQACAQANKDRSEKLTIAVNVGVEELNEDGFVGTLVSLLETYDADPTSLEIEITEGTAMTEGGNVERHVAELVKIGVRFALDDFGMGYSNLGRLRAMAFQTLKMHRSLMAGLGEDPASEHLFATIMDMAKAIDVDVVAEGIETQEQLAFLKKSACGYYQGYFGGKPMPAEDFLAWVHAQDSKQAEGTDAKPALKLVS